jgi:DNA-binding NarL/FixJ family response regulator
LISGGRQRLLLAGTEQVAQVGSWQWCPETGELRWSDNLFRLHGFEPGEVVPSTQLVLGLCHPDDRPRLSRFVQALAREHTAPPIEYRVVRPNGGQTRYLRSTVAAVERDAAEPPLIVGPTQDVTAARLAENEIASRIAVTASLAAWRSFEQGMEGLLRGLTASVGARAGTAWLADGRLLVARLFWSSDVARTADFEVATRGLRLPCGVGLPGRAWDSGVPTVELTADAECERGEAALKAGVRALVAVPIVHSDETLAVVELASVEEVALTGRLVRSLTAMGYEVGEFLAHRRAELAPSALTAREQEVLQLAAQGFSGREIAERLQLSPATIKTHFEHIYSKFGVRGRAAAVAQGLRSGLIV